MTEPLHIEPTTVTDLTHVLFRHHGRQHTKLARSASEFFLERIHPVILKGEHLRDIQIDVRTLVEFVDYLISEKDYN